MSVLVCRLQGHSSLILSSGEYFNAVIWLLIVFCFRLQDKFFAATDSFEENSQYVLSTIKPLGRGASGTCFLALEIPADQTIDGRLFCVKQVNKELLFCTIFD